MNPRKRKLRKLGMLRRAQENNQPEAAAGAPPAPVEEAVMAPVEEAVAAPEPKKAPKKKAATKKRWGKKPTSKLDKE